jgi:succinate dehydrogenase hydrophobic anchor subunit
MGTFDIWKLICSSGLPCQRFIVKEFVKMYRITGVILVIFRILVVPSMITRKGMSTRRVRKTLNQNMNGVPSPPLISLILKQI